MVRGKRGVHLRIQDKVIVKHLKYYITKCCHLTPSNADILVLNFTKAYV